jgi:hypothetical protein
VTEGRDKWWSTPPGPISATFARAGDINADGLIDLVDLTLLLSAFGESGTLSEPAINADFDANAAIDLADLTALLSAFGS